MIWFVLSAIAAAPILVFALRPLYLFKGLKPGEGIAEWPGDRCVPGSIPSGSRGIEIDAPCEAVWPWIAQIGQDRAGFNSYRWFENLLGAKMPDVRHIVPEWSDRHVGEYLAMAPYERFGEISRMKLAEMEPNRRLTYINAEGVWSFILEPLQTGRCRFVCRGTWIPSRNILARLFRLLIFDLGHFLMEWKMMRTVKALAERSS